MLRPKLFSIDPKINYFLYKFYTNYTYTYFHDLVKSPPNAIHTFSVVLKYRKIEPKSRCNIAFLAL